MIRLPSSIDRPISPALSRSNPFLIRSSARWTSPNSSPLRSSPSIPWPRLQEFGDFHALACLKLRSGQHPKQFTAPAAKCMTALGRRNTSSRRALSRASPHSSGPHLIAPLLATNEAVIGDRRIARTSGDKDIAFHQDRMRRAFSPPPRWPMFHRLEAH